MNTMSMSGYLQTQRAPAMTEAERRAEYEICVEHGHVWSGITLTSNPPWFVCARCDVQYRYEPLTEMNVPEPVVQHGA